MGKRGPKPKPTALKLVRGNPGKQKINKREPKPGPGIPTCPKHLTTDAKTEWKRVTKLLLKNGLLTHLDRPMLAAYCQAWARWIDAEKKMATHGPIITTPNGSVQFSPFLNLANKAMKQLKEFGAVFGMSPADRVNLQVNPDAQGKTLDEILNG